MGTLPDPPLAGLDAECSTAGGFIKGALPGVWGIALALAEMGYWVFPLRRGGKKPLGRNRSLFTEDSRGRGGFYAGTRSAERIAFWAEVFPDSNYGVVCGERAGLSVVDLDVHGPSGLDVVEGWAAAAAAGAVSPAAAPAAGAVPPPCFVVETPSGGQHWYFSWFMGRSCTVVEGVELQNWGRFVVGPGSRVGGRLYTALAGDPAVLEACPGWLRRCLGGGGAGEVAAGRGKVSLSGYVETLGVVPRGARHDAVYLEAVGLVAAGWGEEAAVAELRRLVDRWVVDGAAGFTDGELRRNVANALEAVE